MKNNNIIFNLDNDNRPIVEKISIDKAKELRRSKQSNGNYEKMKKRLTQKVKNDSRS